MTAVKTTCPYCGVGCQLDLNVSRKIKEDDLRDAISEAAHAALEDTPLPEGAGLILRSNCRAEDADAIGIELGPPPH